MKRKEAVFITSVASADKFYQTSKPIIAVAGKSNVGKSSLINMLANNSKLAKVSATQGKTKLVNFFLFNKEFILVDLPGYGYAKVSKESQARWQKYLEEYLLNRKQIKSLIQFIDARHEIQKNDYQMREWIQAYNLPIFTIVTKIDYIQRGKIQKIISNVKKEFGGEVLPFSAVDRYYCENTINYLLGLCDN